MIYLLGIKRLLKWAMRILLGLSVSWHKLMLLNENRTQQSWLSC